MTANLEKLVSLASAAILTPPHPLELEMLSSIGKLAIELSELLKLRNGWYAFESALHLFPLGTKDDVLDIVTWNSERLWRRDYASLAEGCYFFAEDAFGVQFCCKNENIQTFDPETGQCKFFATDLEQWAQRILSDYNLHTGYSLAHGWQMAHRPLKQGERLLPKTLFVLGGSYTVENLYPLDCVEGMRFRASIALQLKDIPDKTKVRIRIKT